VGFDTARRAWREADDRSRDTRAGRAQFTVPRLKSYTPTAGESVYLLAGPSLMLAIGTV
jgi:hypothetical protein